MENLGWMSSIFLILCGLPELINGLIRGKVGATWGLLILWFLGEVFGLIYTLSIQNWALMLNYGFNTLIVGALLFLKWRQHGKK